MLCTTNCRSSLDLQICYRISSKIFPNLTSDRHLNTSTQIRLLSMSITQTLLMARDTHTPPAHHHNLLRRCMTSTIYGNTAIAMTSLCRHKPTSPSRLQAALPHWCFQSMMTSRKYKRLLVGLHNPKAKVGHPAPARAKTQTALIAERSTAPPGRLVAAHDAE